MVVAVANKTPGANTCAHGNLAKPVFIVLICVVTCTLLLLSPIPIAHLRGDLQPTIHKPLFYRATTPQIKVYTDAYFKELHERMRNHTTVFYNRVPKCGSQATQAILRILSKRNSINYKSSAIYGKAFIDSTQTRALVQRLNTLKRPWIFDRHVYFIDFEQYNMHMPLYINLVRDPVERAISGYYFKRFEHPKPMTAERRNRTFDACVMQSMHSECNQSLFVVIPFFCGQYDFCKKPQRAALQMAMRNVDHYYGVVGLTEDLMSSYKLMERAMPDLFSDMSIIANGRLGKLKSRFKTHRKPETSHEVKEIMRSRLGLEYEFYNFIKQRYIAMLKYYGVASKYLN